MIEYRIIHGKNGIKDLEKEVTKYINQGWKPIGGVAFNQGHSYQAMAGKVKKDVQDPEQEKNSSTESNSKPLGAAEAMKRVDELT